MQLPIQPALVPGAGPRPFRSTDDVLALLPALLKDAPVDAVRDALLNALTQLLFECEAAGEYAAAQADKVRATAQYLDAIGGDTGVFRADQEDPEAYRTRLLSTPSVVTEKAITAAVNIILAPFTAVQCQFLDAALDRWFVGQGGARAWHSFLGAPPRYPSRLHYSERVANGGIYRPNAEPGGARVFGDANGRMFYLRVPDLSSLNQSQSNVTSRASHPSLSHAPTGFYVGDGSSSLQSTFMSLGSVAIAVYRAIKSTVDDIAGQSVRWVMVSEPGLV